MGFSSCGTQAVEGRLRSCGTWAYLPHGTWNLPRAGIKPVSPALEGRFLSTVPPGKPQRDIFASSLGGGGWETLPKYLRTVLLENLGGATIKQIEAPMSKVYWTEDWAPWWWALQWSWGKYGLQCGPEHRKRGYEEDLPILPPGKSRERQLLWGTVPKTNSRSWETHFKKKK